MHEMHSVLLGIKKKKREKKNPQPTSYWGVRGEEWRVGVGWSYC